MNAIDLLQLNGRRAHRVFHPLLHCLFSPVLVQWIVNTSLRPVRIGHGMFKLIFRRQRQCWYKSRGAETRGVLLFLFNSTLSDRLLMNPCVTLALSDKWMNRRRQGGWWRTPHPFWGLFFFFEIVESKLETVRKLWLEMRNVASTKRVLFSSVDVNFQSSIVSNCLTNGSIPSTVRRESMMSYFFLTEWGLITGSNGFLWLKNCNHHLLKRKTFKSER